MRLQLPIDDTARRSLRAGDEVLLSGVLLTARDAAHERLAALIKKGARLPVDLKDAAVYYCGPTPARPGAAIGACGPTTSSRMDAFAPALIGKGVRVMIGKGDRSVEVKRAIRKHGCVYFIATGGLGALLSTRVTSARVIAYKDLGTEAIHRLTVVDFPVLVGIDTKGRDVYGTAERKRQ